IEWIKGLLAVPFVLHSQPSAAYDERRSGVLAKMETGAHRRYAEIMHDVEELINDHSPYPPKQLSPPGLPLDKSSIRLAALKEDRS
ncbi:MAG: hypothetical protein L6R42_010348, partial [Xanthoria sp. 1 TBL-2021]